MINNFTFSKIIKFILPIAFLLLAFWWWDNSYFGVSYFHNTKDGFVIVVAIPKKIEFGVHKYTISNDYQDKYCKYLNGFDSATYSTGTINFDKLSQDQSKNPNANLMYFYCDYKKVGLSTACQFPNFGNAVLIKTDKYNCYRSTN